MATVNECAQENGLDAFDLGYWYPWLVDGLMTAKATANE
jgi:hypothetical protein